MDNYQTFNQYGTQVINTYQYDDAQRVRDCIVGGNQEFVPSFSNNFPNPAFSPIQVPSCDKVKCLEYIEKEYPDVSPPDIFKSFMPSLSMPKAKIKKVVGEILTNCQSTASSCYDSQYVFNLEDTPYPPYRKYCWGVRNAPDQIFGEDVFSLARTVRGCSDEKAFEFICDSAEIDFKKKNVLQPEKWEGHSFIRNSHTYSYIELLSPVGELLGRPKFEYPFYNADGHPSFKLLEWEINGHPLLLFLTLQQNDQYVFNVWEFFAPPIEYRIYNKHLLETYKEREVHIYDNIRNVSDSDASQAIGTWAGDLSFAFELDWSFLKGRKVKYLFDPKRSESFEIGSFLLTKLEAIGTELQLYEY